MDRHGDRMGLSGWLERRLDKDEPALAHLQRAEVKNQKTRKIIFPPVDENCGSMKDRLTNGKP